MCFFHVPLFNLAWVNRYQYFRKKPEKLFLASKLCRRNIGINFLGKKVLEVNGNLWQKSNQETGMISPNFIPLTLKIRKAAAYPHF